MKQPLIALVAGTAVLAFAVQLQLPPALSGHAAKLKEAPGLKAKVVVTEVGGAESTYQVAFGRPNLLRIEGPSQTVVADGARLTVLDRAKNEYTQANYDAEALAKHASQTAAWAWASFFQHDPAKLFKTAKAGPNRKFAGVDVATVEVALLDGKSTALLFLEAKTGIAKGMQLTAEGKQFVVRAETIELAAPAAEAFAFVAPAGATKLEPGETGAVAWSEVSALFNRNCMPCHSAATKAGTLDLTTYQGVSTHRFVVKGEANNSILARSLRAAGPKRMPQGRPPLPEAQIRQIEAWINGGLKQ